MTDRQTEMILDKTTNNGVHEKRKQKDDDKSEEKEHRKEEKNNQRPGYAYVSSIRYRVGVLCCKWCRLYMDWVVRYE